MKEVEDRHRMRIRVHVHAMQMRTYCLFALRLHVARAALSFRPLRFAVEEAGPAGGHSGSGSGRNSCPRYLWPVAS